MGSAKVCGNLERLCKLGSSDQEGNLGTFGVRDPYVEKQPFIKQTLKEDGGRIPRF